MFGDNKTQKNLRSIESVVKDQKLCDSLNVILVIIMPKEPLMIKIKASNPFSTSRLSLAHAPHSRYTCNGRDETAIGT